MMHFYYVKLGDVKECRKQEIGEVQDKTGSAHRKLNRNPPLFIAGNNYVFYLMFKTEAGGKEEILHVLLLLLSHRLY